MPDRATLEADGLRLAEPIAWTLHIYNTGGDDDYIVEGSVEGVAKLECRRCLDEVLTELRSDFLYPMLYKPGVETLALIEEEEDDDILVFGKPEVDFAPLLAQVFAIELPITVLCKETCKGLSVDGVNLNEHPDHVPDASNEQETADSPFAVLKDLDL